MSTPLLDLFEDFRNILCLCPCCGEVIRLTDIQLSYDAEPSPSWLDDLESKERNLDSATERFDEQEARIRELAKERANKQLPKLLRRADPIFSRRGYFPQDVKTLFDPVEFVIFQGMNREDRIRQVVFFDAEAATTSRQQIRESIRAAIQKGNLDWKTLRLSKEGKVQLAQKA